MSLAHYLLPQSFAPWHTYLLKMGEQPIILQTKLLCLSFCKQLLDLGTLEVLQLSGLDPCKQLWLNHQVSQVCRRTFAYYLQSPSEFLYQLGLSYSKSGKLHR